MAASRNSLTPRGISAPSARRMRKFTLASSLGTLATTHVNLSGSAHSGYLRNASI
jgi:hypothetical protein